MQVAERVVTRRTVSMIREYLSPHQIYLLITQRSWPYKENKEFYETRDRAFMAMAFMSAGRISPLVGDVKYARVNGKVVKVGKYRGLRLSNFEVHEDFIIVKNMEVGKRSQKVIQKHSQHVTVRDDFPLPLKTGLFENRYWDQFVPFSYLVLDYLKLLEGKPPETRLFPFNRSRGWQIINYVTGMFPNWFRAQCEHFRGHFIDRDSVKLSKFIKVVRPEQVSHYIGYEWRDQLKQTKKDLDFEWIEQILKERGMN